MYGWERYLCIEEEFLRVRQFVPYELENVYSEFFTRQIIFLGAEIEAALKKLCGQLNSEKSHGNIGQIKEVLLTNCPGIIYWKCTVWPIEKDIIPFENWNQGKLKWWDVYSTVKHNEVDKAATYKVALNMLGAYEEILLLIEATDSGRLEFVGQEKAVTGSVWNKLEGDGLIKNNILLDMPHLLVPDIEFGVGNMAGGLPGMVYYPENVLNKVNFLARK